MRIARFVLLFCALAATGSPALAFEKDTHYYLTFAIALRCCFTFEQAHQIASANWGQDLNATVVARLPDKDDENKRNNDKRINREWHALDTDAMRKDQRREALWQRAGNEADADKQLVKLGQFLHFAQDQFAHEGYGEEKGHVLDTANGSDPDSLAGGKDIVGMVRLTVERLCAAQAKKFDLTKLDAGLRDKIKEVQSLLGAGEAGDANRLKAGTLLGDLKNQSKADWLTTGEFLKGKPKYTAILKLNRERIEKFLRDDAITKAKLPKDFKEIPDEQKIKIDENGDLVAGTPQSRDSDVALVCLRPLGGGASAAAFRFQVVNQGSVSSLASSVLVQVLDPASGETLGQGVQSVPDLVPGGTFADTVSVPLLAGLPSPALVWAVVPDDDRSAPYIEWLMLFDPDNPPTQTYGLTGGGRFLVGQTASLLRIDLYGPTTPDGPGAFSGSVGISGSLSAFNYATRTQIDLVAFSSLEGTQSDGGDFAVMGAGTASVNGALLGVTFVAARQGGVVSFMIRSAGAGAVLAGGAGQPGRAALDLTIASFCQ